jgi:hypothetical protein
MDRSILERSRHEKEITGREIDTGAVQRAG